MLHRGLANWEKSVKVESKEGLAKFPFSKLFPISLKNALYNNARSWRNEISFVRHFGVSSLSPFRIAKRLKRQDVAQRFGALNEIV